MHVSSQHHFAAPARAGLRGRIGLGLLVAFSGLVCTGLGGCAVAAKDGSAGLDSQFGDAVRANRAAQFVAPSPEQKANTFIPPNAARQRLAVETYEAGEVEISNAASTAD